MITCASIYTRKKIISGIKKVLNQCVVLQNNKLAIINLNKRKSSGNAQLTS